MRILVTGGSGFLGSAVIRNIEQDSKSQIDVLDHNLPRFETRARSVQGDIMADLSELPSYDVILHLAGRLGTSELMQNVNIIKKATAINVLGTLNILEVGRGKRVIQPNLLGDWPNCYMISKRCAENYGRMYRRWLGTEYVSIRPTDIYGPGQSTKHGKCVPSFTWAALQDKPLQIYGSGEYVMKLIYVDDIAKVFSWAALDPEPKPEVIEAGTLQQSNWIRVCDLARKIVAITGSESSVEHLPMRVGQPPEITEYFFDEAQAQQLYSRIDLVETPLEEGLRRTAMYYRDKLYAETQDYKELPFEG